MPPKISLSGSGSTEYLPQKPQTEKLEEERDLLDLVVTDSDRSGKLRSRIFADSQCLEKAHGDGASTQERLRKLTFLCQLV